MAVPANPSVTSIVTQALKRAGRTTPTAAQITEATDHALQEVKADIMLKAPTHSNLVATVTSVTTRGQQRYAVPDDFNRFVTLKLLNGPDEWRGTVQTGGTSSVTLAAGLTASVADLEGKYILITSGPGIEEYREIVSYTPATRVAIVDLPWLNIPTTTSTYLIVNQTHQLFPITAIEDFEKIETPSYLDVPVYATEFNQEFLLHPIPDKSTYGLLNRYYVDLSKLDETGDLFIQLLREWRSLWIQGIAVKSMQRFDEDRYQTELGTYNFMLDSLAAQTCSVRASYFKDV